MEFWLNFWLNLFPERTYFCQRIAFLFDFVEFIFILHITVLSLPKHSFCLLPTSHPSSSIFYLCSSPPWIPSSLFLYISSPFNILDVIRNLEKPHSLFSPVEHQKINAAISPQQVCMLMTLFSSGRPTMLCETMGKAEIWLIRTYWDF